MKTAAFTIHNIPWTTFDIDLEMSILVLFDFIVHIYMDTRQLMLRYLIVFEITK